MAIVPTIRLDVSEDAPVNIDHIIDDTRVVVTDRKVGAGFIGCFMTLGLSKDKIIERIEFLRDAAFRHRQLIGSS